MSELRKFLKVSVMAEDENDVEAIIAGIMTTIRDRESTIDDHGDSYTEIMNQEELMNEMFALGMSFQKLEQEGYDNPFSYEMVELHEPPPEPDLDAEEIGEAGITLH